MASCGSFQIRQASLSDLDRIAEMEAAIWKDMAADREMLARRFRRFPAGFLLAENRSFLAGFCMALRVRSDSLSGNRILGVRLEHHDPSGEALFLLGLTVDPLMRLNRIGSALAEGEVELALRLDCQSVELIANSYSRSLFERLGFRVARHLDERPFASFRELMPEPVHMIKELAGIQAAPESA